MRLDELHRRKSPEFPYLEDYAKTPGGKAWIAHVWRNHMATQYQPNLDGYQGMREYVDSLNLSPARAVRISVPQAQEGAAKMQAPPGRRRRLSMARMGADARWEWKTPFNAQFWLGQFNFFVSFGGSRGHYVRGWAPAGNSPMRSQRGTGLFPAITEMLRQITIDFLTKRKPQSLTIEGADAKRNAFNAANYGAWTPPGYRFELEKDPESERAAADGTIGVRFVKTVNEEVAQIIDSPYVGGQYPIYRNGDRGELMDAWKDRTTREELRGLLNEDDLYFWDGYVAIHEQIKSMFTGGKGLHLLLIPSLVTVMSVWREERRGKKAADVLAFVANHPRIQHIYGPNPRVTRGDLQSDDY